MDIIQNYKSRGISSISGLDNSKLEEIIKYVNQLYYGGGESPITDNEYDILREYILKKNPNSEQAINQHQSYDISGSKNKVELPFQLWSMDKIKPNTNAVSNWVKKFTGDYVISCKLDGISALYVSGKNQNDSHLYTRGNGREGQDISHLIKHIIWKNKEPYDFRFEFVLRGEIIIKKEIFNEKYKDKFANPRNFVAGLVNKKTIDPNILVDLDFIPYEVIQPELKPSQQMKFIDDEWISKPVTFQVKSEINNEILSNILLDWREKSEYEIDGIIVVDNKIYERPNKNPDYAFAFKMIISGQVAETKVLEVIWTASKDGYLKPRIKIEPVELGGVLIEYATGFNAKFVKDNNIGIGALITIMRSGDVIPHIISVVQGADKVMMPENPEKYSWNSTGVDLVLNDKEDNRIVNEKNIVGFFKILGVEGIGIGNIKRIMDAGFDTTCKIIKMNIEDFLKVDGFKQKMSEKVYNSIKDKIEKANLCQIMAASNLFGRGFGETRFESIINMYPDILTNQLDKNEKIEKIKQVDGIAGKTAIQFVNNIEKFISFINEANLQNKLDNNKLISSVIVEHELTGKKIVMTGFRDKELIEKLKSIGCLLSDSVTKNTHLVLVKDKDDDTAKINQAKDLNIDLMLPEEFKNKYGL